MSGLWFWEEWRQPVLANPGAYFWKLYTDTRKVLWDGREI